MQQKRVLKNNDGDLLKYLEEDNDNVVIASLLAIANIGDTGKIITDAVAERLDDPEETARYTAAFTLGSLPSVNSEKHLLKALATEKSTIVLSMIIDAIGRVGSETSLDRVSKFSTNSDELNSSIAMSIARFGMRKIKDQQGFDKLFSIFQPGSTKGNDIQVFRNAVYALSRIGEPAYLERFKPVLQELKSVGDPEIRMWIYSAIGKTKDSALAKDIIYDYGTESDWRVKVNILNALGNMNLQESGIRREDILDFIFKQTHDNDQHISLTALNLLNKVFVEKGDEIIKQNLLDLAKNSQISNIKSQAILVLAEIYKDNVKNELFDIFLKEENYQVKSSVISAFRYFNEPLIYKEVREIISDDVKRYNELNPNKSGALIGSEDLAKLYRSFLEMLLELDDKMTDEDRNNVRLIYTEFLNSGDPVISSYAVNGLTDGMYKQYRQETIQVLLFDYLSLKTTDMKQVYIYALGELRADESVKMLEEITRSDNYILAKESSDALLKITGKSYQKLAEKVFHPDLDWNYFETITNKKNITIVTNKGKINIELLPEYAPFTVMNFLKLTEKDYFNGSLFHRVVPNFVIQTGDPTGTGYSGPGYAIRTEIALVNFGTGYVGMASSGKDTEGSQFFITHSPQPHLDGKYTIFGKVTEGMDVVDKIYQGDAILSVIIK